jgi:type I restriction enzyme M protein
MAHRPIFIATGDSALYSALNAEFTWSSGFALSQQRKNVSAMHEYFKRLYPDKQILEISGKSTEKCGIDASAFSLKKYVPSLGISVEVERIFQSSKVFREGGPYNDILQKTPKEAKQDERLKNSGPLVKFIFEGSDYPIFPKTAFYDFIYINALLENHEVANKLLKYDAFTDIAFNPQKSINCQARAAAIYVSLVRRKLIEKALNFSEFLKLFAED